MTGTQSNQKTASHHHLPGVLQGRCRVRKRGCVWPPRGVADLLRGACEIERFLLAFYFETLEALGMLNLWIDGGDTWKRRRSTPCFISSHLRLYFAFLWYSSLRGGPLVAPIKSLRLSYSSVVQLLGTGLVNSIEMESLVKPRVGKNGTTDLRGRSQNRLIVPRSRSSKRPPPAQRVQTSVDDLLREGRINRALL